MGSRLCDSWYWFFFAPFWSNRKITKWLSKNLGWNVYYWYLFIYPNAKFIVICKPRTLNDGKWRLSSIQKTQKKALLLSCSHFDFYSWNCCNLIASLSHLEALLLDVTSYLLHNCSFLNKGSETAHQRETITKWPMWLALRIPKDYSYHLDFFSKKNVRPTWV